MTRLGTPAVAFSLCIAISLFARTIGPAELFAQPAPRSGTDPSRRIDLDVVVTDAAGKPVSGLAPRDFTLIDNGVAQKIISFHASDDARTEPKPSVEIILVFDTVNNGFADLAITRQGVEKFLRQNGGHLVQPVSIYLLNSAGLSVPSQPSSDGNALAESLKRIKASNRPTGGDLPFVRSLRALIEIAQRETKTPGRKMVVWLGNGWEVPFRDPKTPVVTAQDQRNQLLNFQAIVSLSTLLRKGRVTLYGGYANGEFIYRKFVAGADNAAQVDNRMLSLDVLSLQSGGRGQAGFSDRYSDQAEQLNNIVEESRAFYTLSFDPPDTDKINERHSLKVLVARPELNARTNTGYYNQPQSRPKPNEGAGASPSDSGRSSVPAPAPHPVTVEQLEKFLKDSQRYSDAELARGIAGLELTERLSSEKLSSWVANLPGPNSREAFVALSDASAFLNLPVREILDAAPPSFSEQRSIVARAVDYLGKTIPKLPNFYATRTTTYYEDARQGPDRTKILGATGHLFQVMGSSRATVIYRDGKEVVETDSRKNKKPNAEAKGLITRGTFGPILSVVMVDAAHGAMKFSHWERGDTVAAHAVFRFSVPKSESHYEVAYHGISAENLSEDLQEQSAYHGEIAIDPATGTILRLALQADLEPNLSIQRADVMVEYRPVDIGGKTYHCPVRSVSLSRELIVDVLHDDGNVSRTQGPSVTMLSDVAFRDYHVFRAEMRVVPEDGPRQQ